MPGVIGQPSYQPIAHRNEWDDETLLSYVGCTQMMAYLTP